MADSNITVSALSLASGIGHNLARWAFNDPNANGLDYLKLDAVELYARQINDRGPDNALLATKIGEGRDQAGHFAIGSAETWYYWVRARNRAVGPNGRRYYGDWHPSGATSGVSGTTVQVHVGDAFLMGSATLDSNGEATVTLDTAFPSVVPYISITRAGTPEQNDVFSFTGNIAPSPGNVLSIKGKKVTMSGGVTVIQNAASVNVKWLVVLIQQEGILF